MITKRAHHFNAWLDALVAGGAPSTGAPDADTSSLRDIARTVQSAAQESVQRPDHRSLPHTWEDFMTTHDLAPNHAPTLRTQSTPVQASRAPGSGGRAAPTTAGSRTRLHWLTRGVNAILAAMLVLGLIAGGWLTATRFGIGPFSNEDPPTSIPFAGLSQDDATPFGGDIDPAALPKAEDCTIEPLTVDEVLWYIQEPSTASVSLGPESTPLAGFPYPDPATPPATNVPIGPASQSDLDLMVETQRMWMACVLADSPFQVWATMSPDQVGRELEMQLPPLTGVDEAREILEAIQDDTYTPETPYFSIGSPLGSTCGDMVVISSNPEDSYGSTMTATVPEGTQSKYGYYAVRFTFYDEHGNPIVREGEPLNLEYAYSNQLGFTFHWNDARQAWLVVTIPNCG